MEIGRIQDEVTRLTPNGNRIITALLLPEINIECYHTVSAVCFQLSSAFLKL